MILLFTFKRATVIILNTKIDCFLIYILVRILCARENFLREIKHVELKYQQVS